METQVDLEKVLRYLRETIASQAQEIAILKATLDQIDEKQPANS